MNSYSNKNTKNRRLSSEFIEIDIVVPETDYNSPQIDIKLNSHSKKEEENQREILEQPNPWDRSQLFTPQQDEYDDPFQRS